MLLLTIFVSISLISLWVYLRRGKSITRAVLVATVLFLSAVTMVWGGPLSSGALFLLLPAPSRPAPAERLLAIRPMHRGRVDLATGLYIREDEDIVLSELPAFVGDGCTCLAIGLHGTWVSAPRTTPSGI